jgi:transcriptional regulator with XRE-family HTH domain
MQYNLKTPKETATALSKRAKELRLSKNWKRSTLSKRSGVSISSLRRFEQNAQISLANLLKIMSTFGRIDEIDRLLLPPAIESIDDLDRKKSKKRKRGTL